MQNPWPDGGWSLPLARGRTLRIERPLVMGILNVTPDSFSDGGTLPTPDAAAQAALRMRAEGAHILDVGGESTRPGHADVPAEEEVRRVVPAIQAIRAAAPDAVVSIDTRKAAVARAALAAGADFVNDVTALGDPGMAAVVRDAGCAVVLMRHVPLAGEPVAACREQLAGHVRQAVSLGLRREQLILDPGLGFGDPPGADVTANMALLRGASGYGNGLPVLVGASRKRFIGTMTGVKQPKDRVAGSVAAAVLAVQGGAAIVRVHDVGETAQALRALDAVK